MATTIDDIARVAGVSRATVARALSGKYGASSATAERIREIAKQLNYRPNYAARTLAVGKSRTIVVVATSSMVSALQSVLESVESRLLESGYATLVYTLSGEASSEKACLQQLVYDRVAGVIAVPGSDLHDPASYRELASADIKVVLTNAVVPDLDAPQIVADYYDITRKVALYLVSLGHTSIAYLAPTRPSWLREERLRGFRDAMLESEAGLSEDMVVEVPYDQAEAAQVMAGLLRRDYPPTAVMAYHDVVALGCMQAVFAAGLTVPDDVSIFGDGDIWCNSLLRVPLSSVRYAWVDMLAEGTNVLLDMLSGVEVEHSTRVFPAELVARSSCAPPKSLPGYGKADLRPVNLALSAFPSALHVQADSSVHYAIDGDHSTAYHSAEEFGWFELSWSEPITFTRTKLHLAGNKPLSDFMDMVKHAFGMVPRSEYSESVQEHHALNVQRWDDAEERWYDVVNVGNSASVVLGEDTLFDLVVPGGKPITTTRLRMNYAAYQRPKLRLKEWSVHNSPVDVSFISGRVVDEVSGLGLVGVKVSTAGGDYTAESGQNGVYYLKVPPGNYDLTAFRHFYRPAAILDVMVGECEKLIGNDFAMAREPIADIAPFANPYAASKLSVLWEMLAIDGGREPFTGVSNWGSIGDGSYCLDWGVDVEIGKVVFVTIYADMNTWTLQAWDSRHESWRPISEGLCATIVVREFPKDARVVTSRLRLEYTVRESFHATGLISIQVFSDSEV